jgi:enamine deaminase RidA (YjgF/YER057c/UK114 family)
MEDFLAAIFEPVRAAGPFVFVSGQTPLQADGAVSGDAGAQARVVIRKIEALLVEQGLDLGSVVKVTYFLTDIGDLAAVRTALDEVLPQPRPAASLVEISALIDPRFRIEIEAIAVRG